MDTKQVLHNFQISEPPNYVPQQDEEIVFRTAFQAHIPLTLKGPTGCGKTRFVEPMRAS